MDISVCIKYKPDGYSHGSAMAMDSNCLHISNFKVCRREDCTTVVEFIDESNTECVLSDFNRQALSPILAEYMRLKLSVDRLIARRNAAVLTLINNGEG